jgi:hypothetical protein
MAGTAFDYTPLITQLAIGLATGSIAAFLTAKFALGRFYKEKWWEKRLESFTETIEISYRLMKSDEYFYEIESAKLSLQSKDFNRHEPNTEKLLSDQYWVDLQEIERISQLSEFTLTSKAAEIISDFLLERKRTREAFDEDSITSFDASDKDLFASKTLLARLVSEAKKELRVK